MTENQENLVDLGSKVVGQIELPSIDISPYVGKMVKVADVKEYEGNYGYYIRITTETVATLDQKDKDGNPIIDEQVTVVRQTAATVRIYRRAQVQTMSCSPYCESSFKSDDERVSEAEMNNQ